MITPDGTKKYLQEVGPLIGGGTSNQSGTSNWRCHLWLEVRPLIGGETSDQRCHLWSEMRPLIRGGTSDWRWLMHVGPHRGTHVTCRNQLFFWKKKRLFIVDYIKPSPVYQVKCKLVFFFFFFFFFCLSRGETAWPWWLQSQHKTYDHMWYWMGRGRWEGRGGVQKGTLG